VLHPPPIVFKGSGFYITDSRKGSQATLAENSRWDTASEANKPAESSTPASDSKPATTASSGDSASSD
jgi:predicted nucleic acid-binding Zn ribbon protein